MKPSRTHSATAAQAPHNTAAAAPPNAAHPAAAAPSIRLANPTSLIEHKHMRFLIFDAPSERNIDLYIRDLLANCVTDVVRVCDPTYDKAAFERVGIRVHEWPFPDGDAPPESIVQAWLALLNQRFGSGKEREKPGSASLRNGSNSTQSQMQQGQTQQGQSSSPPQTMSAGSSLANDHPCIGVHCVAGLGRAPVLVAMALIESGMAPLDSVIFIRERRRGAINARQLKYLEAYKRRGKEKTCLIM